MQQNNDNKHITNETPGMLKNSTSFAIHTKTAQKIILGSHYDLQDNKFIENESKGYAPPGYFQFAARITKLFKALAQDDPFAELYLAMTYKAIIATNKKIAKEHEHLQVILDDVSGLDLKPYTTDKPKKYIVNSRNPYTGMALRVILAYDNLVRLIYAGQDMMVWDRNETNSLMREVRRMIRQIFYMPFHWHYTGVTRYDIRHNTPKSKQAYKRMQVTLSSEIITGTFRAPLVSVKKI